MEHPGFYTDYSDCPWTGLKIPKEQEENIKWRRRLRIAANDDLGLRQTLKQACAQSPIFWLNAFGWTFHQKRVYDDGVERSVRGIDVHVPFITWKVQDEAIELIKDAIENGRNLLIDKSRDMGASWIIISMFHWYWQFVPGCTFLEMSRNEKYVDKRGDMDTLIEKHRYLHKMQPAWLRPSMDDQVMHLKNQNNGNLISGESTNEHAGQGGRKTAVLMDECARMREAEEIDLALTDTTSCKIYNSTPQPNSYFGKLKRSRICTILEMPWWRHPLKGRGCELVDAHGAEIGYTCPINKKWTSQWYNIQVNGIRDPRDPDKWINEPRTKKDLAQNVDMNHDQAGSMFFDSGEVEMHRRRFACDPLQVGSIAFLDQDLRPDQRYAILKRRLGESLTWTKTGERGWRLWCGLIDGRPDQTHAYTLGVDISAGTGGSNSVITVYDADTNRIVAKFWSATISPYDLCEEAIKAGVWFGGRTGAAVLNWETTGGVGSQFTKQLKTIGYRPQYVRRHSTKRGEPKVDQRGWHNTPVTKEVLLAEYAQGMKALKVINPCDPALDECLGYHYDDLGRLKAGAGGIDDDSGASATHGDHVIADGLSYLAREDVGKAPAVPVKVPKDSYEGMKRRDMQRRNRKDEWN